MATPTLLDRMRQDMQLRGLAARTQKSYLDVVGSVATFCGRPPNALPMANGERWAATHTL